MPNYVKNPTWADGSGGGTPITAAKLNNVEGGIFDAHYQAAARVYHNANQSINSGSATILAMNSELFDTESNASSTIHDTVTNNSRLTCRTSGKYLISANIQWANNATGIRELGIKLNATSYVAYTTYSVVANANTVMHLTALYDLAVNDYVEVEVTQSSGSPLNVTTNGTWSPAFSMVRVA